MQRSQTWIACLSLVVATAGCRGPESREEAGRTKSSVDAGVAVMVSDAALGKQVTASGPPNSQYEAQGLQSLVDGRMGSEDYQDLEWMGWWYEDEPFEATIDLGRVVAIRELGVHTLTSTEAWIFYPRKVEFELSRDGMSYRRVATIEPTKAELENQEPEAKILRASNLRETARYVRVRVQRYGALPEWHIGHGGADGYEGEAWLFIDEILVNPS